MRVKLEEYSLLGMSYKDAADGIDMKRMQPGISDPT